jgi:hypothetical protein
MATSLKRKWTEGELWNIADAVLGEDACIGGLTRSIIVERLHKKLCVEGEERKEGEEDESEEDESEEDESEEEGSEEESESEEEVENVE